MRITLITAPTSAMPAPGKAEGGECRSVRRRAGVRNVVGLLRGVRGDTTPADRPFRGTVGSRAGVRRPGTRIGPLLRQGRSSGDGGELGGERQLAGQDGTEDRTGELAGRGDHGAAVRSSSMTTRRSVGGHHGVHRVVRDAYGDRLEAGRTAAGCCPGPGRPRLRQRIRPPRGHLRRHRARRRPAPTGLPQDRCGARYVSGPDAITSSRRETCPVRTPRRPSCVLGRRPRSSCCRTSRRSASAGCGCGWCRRRRGHSVRWRRRGHGARCRRRRVRPPRR